MLSLAAGLLLILGSQLVGQQKRPYAGLSGPGPVVKGTPDDPLRDPREVHLRHVKQLTFGGQNAEAYFSYDGQRLILQSTRPPYPCDQIFIMNVDGSDVRLISTGKGKTTCAWFYPDGKRLIFASNCETPGSSQFELYAVDLEGRNLERITFADGFTTFPMCSFDGKKLVFASNRNGKLPHEINIFVADWVP